MTSIPSLPAGRPAFNVSSRCFPIASQSLACARVEWKIAGTGDFNGDGRSDILWRNDTGQVTNWLGTASGAFNSNWDAANYSVGADWAVTGTGDFNGDGRADILWRNVDGTITDWLGQSNGGFVSNDAVARQFVNTSLQIAGVGDFNGDGFNDVLLRSTDGTLETWEGSAEGAILSPMEKLWRDALANVSDFVEQIGAIVATASSDEGSGGGGGLTPLSGEYRIMFGPNFPNVHVDGVYENEFSRASDDGYTLSIGFGGVFGSITQLSTAGTFIFQVNGIDLVGDWHAGSPPPVNSGDIVVTGQRDAPTGYFQINPILNGFDFGDGYGGGGGGGGLAPQPATFATTNLAIASLHAKLASADDRDTKEHFAIIYQNASGYHVSPLFPGTSLEGNLAPLFGWMATNGIAFSQVVSLYHNHDAYEYGTDSDAVAANRYPSNNNGHGQGDWPTADFFVQHGTNPSVFTLSLEDVDHAVRYFSYSQESTYASLTRDQRINGNELPSPILTH